MSFSQILTQVVKIIDESYKRLRLSPVTLNEIKIEYYTDKLEI